MKREALDSVDTARNGKNPGTGRFVRGNKLAANRNSRRAWQQAFNDAFSPEDLSAVVRKAIEQAKLGDRFAREWLGTYSLQRPPQMVDVTSHGGEGEWDFSLGPNPEWAIFE
jgi:hypothetical protein